MRRICLQNFTVLYEFLPFFLISFDFSVVFFQMDMFNAFGNYIFYEFKVIHHS